MSNKKSTAPVLFSDLKLSENTLKGLKECNYRELTEIQRRTIGCALQGYDLVAAAKTGSGKTLAFLIPIIEHLYNEKWEKNHGLRALIIAPVRELAQQIYNVIAKVAKYHDVSIGLIIGGQNLKREKNNIDRCNILIGTPGRILQHMNETFIFNCVNTKYLVLDEADRCLDLGFRKEMDYIIENLPAERQTLLFSATQTKSVEDLARLSLKKPKYVSVHEHATHATPDGLQQLYMTCQLGDKISLLWSFIKRHQKHKIVVFFSTCKQVKFVYEAFRHLKPGVSLLALYGTLHQERRKKIVEEFNRKQHAVLFATDIAARGLDFSNVTWAVQMDCPEDVKTYIHRVGRTARMNKGGDSLLVLLPSEIKMIEKLQKNGVPIKESKANHKEIQSTQRKLEALIGKYTELKECAQRALKQYVKSVFLMKDKSIFDFKALDTDAFARSLGLSETPRIRALERREKKRAEMKKMENEDGISSDEDVKRIDVNHKKEISTFHDDDEDNESDDCLTIKRKNVQIDDDEDSEPQNNFVTKKAVTKAAAAKKTLRKKILPNKKITFDEEGQEIIDSAKSKVSELGRKYENEETSGINFEVSAAILKEEDQVDRLIYRNKIREKHREEKKKRKAMRKPQKDEEDKHYNDADESYDSGAESSESETLQQLISDLPDPDKYYGKKENTSDEENDDDEDEIHRPKRKLVTLDEIKNKKRKTDLSDDEDDNEVQYSLKTDEELALQLLRG